jgi:hypothetical protein
MIPPLIRHTCNKTFNQLILDLSPQRAALRVAIDVIAAGAFVPPSDVTSGADSDSDDVTPPLFFASNLMPYQFQTRPAHSPDTNSATHY